MSRAQQLLESLRAFTLTFRNRELRSLQLAGIGSTLGTWAYLVALAVYAYQAGGARAVGLIAFVRWGLAAGVAPWLALVADRVSRRRVMLAADLTRVALAAGMAALAALGGPSLAVYALAVFVSIVSTAFPPAQAALLPSLATTPEELTSANVAMSTIASVGFLVGPAIGGVVLAVSGPSAVFAVTAGTFLWSALCVLQVRSDPRPKAEGDAAALLDDLLAGFRAIVSAPALRIVIGLTDRARELLGNLGFDPTYGARPLKRVIQKNLVDVLALRLLEGEFAEGDTVEVDAKDGELTFAKAKKRAGAKKSAPTPEKTPA